MAANKHKTLRKFSAWTTLQRLANSQVSYQDVPFKKKTWFNGDADAGLAVTLNITAKRKQKEKHHNMFNKMLLNQ